MTSLQKYSTRVEALITLADETYTTVKYPQGIGSVTVNRELFNELRTSSLSFIKNLYGDKHPYFIDFEKKTGRPELIDTKNARGILKAIKAEIDNDWLSSLKGLVSAEIFSDFLEMAEHLLSEKYEHPAAVMIGSVLEEHLRQLCDKNGIAVTENKNGKLVPKKADLLNADLAGQGVYNKLDQKNVTAWLDLRNKAAHGKYMEYNIQQVEFMFQAVTEFISRNSL
jgi:hypothetical protein